MDRKWKSGAAGSPPASDNASDGYATAGNPATGTPATKPGPHWFHMITEEIIAVIVQGGLTPDKTVVTQLRDAILAMIAGDVSDKYATAAISSGTVTFDLNVARTFKIAFTANITTTNLSNVPSAGSSKLGYFNIKITADGSARTWAWLTSTVIWPGGVAPTFTTTNNKRDWFFVWTDDGGTTWFGRIIGQNY